MSLLDEDFDFDILSILANKYIKFIKNAQLLGNIAKTNDIYAYDGIETEGDGEIVLYKANFFKTKTSLNDYYWIHEFYWAPLNYTGKKFIGMPEFVRNKHVTPDNVHEFEDLIYYETI